MPYKTNEEKSAAARFRYQKHKLLHECVKCGKQDAYTIAGKTTCYDCTQKIKKYNKRYRNDEWFARRIEQDKKDGVCTCCHKRKAEYGYVTCSHCRAVKRNKYNTSTDKLSVQKALYCGLCEWCRKKPQMKDKKLCPECYERSLINIKKAQEASTANNAYHKWRTVFKN